MNAWGEFFRALLGLGLEPKEFTFLQISLRGLVVFFVALVLVRLSDRRALAKKSPFDILLVVILASVLSRAINGSASFLPTLGGAAVLVCLHRLLAFAASRSPTVLRVIKGNSTVLVRNGAWDEAALRRTNTSPEDVKEDMRLVAKTDDLKRVRLARLEVGGDISFILVDAGG